MNMEKDRVEEIRKLGDQLAAYVSGENDRRFFRAFFTERNYGNFRTALIKANIAHVRRGNPPFITLDPYIEVFEAGDEVARSDWQLARDLVLIRMVEQLHQAEWLGKNIDLLTTDTEDTTDAAS
jgi:CRISPR-associated protein Cst1